MCGYSVGVLMGPAGGRRTQRALRCAHKPRNAALHGRRADARAALRRAARRPSTAHLQDALHHLVVHVCQRHHAVDGDAARLLLLERDVGRAAVQPHAHLRAGGGQGCVHAWGRRRLAAWPCHTHVQASHPRSAPPRTHRLQLAGQDFAVVVRLAGVQHHKQQVGALAHRDDLAATACAAGGRVGRSRCAGR